MVEVDRGERLLEEAFAGKKTAGARTEEEEPVLREARLRSRGVSKCRDEE